MKKYELEILALVPIKNKTMRLIKIITLAFMMVLVFNSCNKKCHDPSNPECENYDPCAGRMRTSAYFVIEERIQNTERWIECDSVNGIGNISVVRFRALHNADSFIWTLGSETIHTKSFTRLDFPQMSYIPVTLVVINKNPNKVCFPNDDGRDTFKRIMYTWGKEMEWVPSNNGYKIVNPKPIQGIYKGYYKSNPHREITVILKDTVYSCSILQNQSVYGLIGYNLPEGYRQPTVDDNNCAYFGGGWTKHPIAASIHQRAYRITDYGRFIGDSIIQIYGFIQMSRNLELVEINIEYFPLWDAVNKKTLKKDKFIGRKMK